MENNDKIIEQSIGRMKRHKWKDGNICIKCGIEKRKRPLLTRYTLFLKGNMTEYLVDGKWINSSPNCI